jgi:hypothetical protein
LGEGPEERSHIDRQRGEAAGAAQHQLSTPDDTDDRIVHVARDGAIVHQEEISDRLELSRASYSSVQMGSSERFPLVATMGKPSSAISK